MVGEASYSLAKTCFGGGINGNAGHDEADVLYIAFTGGGAAPGKQLDWQAKDSAAFQASLAEFGQKLVAKL